MNKFLKIKDIRAIIVVLILFIALCGNKQAVEAKTASISNPVVDQSDDENPDDLYTQPNIANTIGVVSFRDMEGSLSSVPIEFMNEDGSTWFSFKLLAKGEDAEKNSKSLGEKLDNGLHPRLIEYYFDVFVVDCVSESDDYYTVIVNYKTRETKRLKKTNGLVFETWAQHVASGVMLTPYPSDKPLFDKPNGKPSIKPFLEDAYTGIEMQGDWLKVGKLFDDELKQSGWLRWRDGDQLLVQIYYMY